MRSRGSSIGTETLERDGPTMLRLMASGRVGSTTSLPSVTVQAGPSAATLTNCGRSSLMRTTAVSPWRVSEWHLKTCLTPLRTPRSRSWPGVSKTSHSVSDRRKTAAGRRSLEREIRCCRLSPCRFERGLEFASLAQAASRAGRCSERDCGRLRRGGRRAPCAQRSAATGSLRTRQPSAALAQARLVCRVPAASGTARVADCGLSRGRTAGAWFPESRLQLSGRAGILGATAGRRVLRALNSSVERRQLVRPHRIVLVRLLASAALTSTT